MEDFVFGTFASDELKLAHHRLAGRGVHHLHALDPMDPEPGQPIRVSVWVGQDVDAEHVSCYYTLDGSDPEGGRGNAERGEAVRLEKVHSKWDTLAWGYLARWEGVIPPQEDGAIVRYALGAWSEGGDEVFADWPEIRPNVEAFTSAHFAGRSQSELAGGPPSERRVFEVRIDRARPPVWAANAIIYHIFVDRFSPGPGRDWEQTGDVRKRMGGTLWGVLSKLDYLSDLGVNCLWLSPIFTSPSHHRYDATDLTEVDPGLGGGEALSELVSEAHGRGLRILLDLALNHLSSQHPRFLEARKNASSPYRDWFVFDDSPVGYKTFFDVPTMPQVNERNPEVREWLFDAAAFWLSEYEVDGFRLDYANGPGPDFWAGFRARCRQARPEALTFGEVIDTPTVQRTYAGRLDGALDFHTADALRKTFALGSQSHAALGSFLKRHIAFFPADFVLPSFVDNHDMDRFLFLARGDKNALRRAARIQMRLPGPPIIYYGTEVGLSQSAPKTSRLGLDAAREPMPWGPEQDKDLLDFYRAVLEKRRTSGPDPVDRIVDELIGG